MKKAPRVYVERRNKKDYAVREEWSKRASKAAPTQKKAIKVARKVNPRVKPNIERVRSTKRGAPDKWRKA